MKTFLINKTVVILITLLAAGANAATAVTPSKPAEALVTPILDLLVQAKSLNGEQQQAAYWQSGKLLGRLFQLKTRASDEAMVVLMDFYVGEASGADLLHQVTVRGKRMLPLLFKYRNSSVVFTNREYPSFLLSREDVKIEDFDATIGSIKAGRAYGED
jgi:hypothetical protein